MTSGIGIGWSLGNQSMTLWPSRTSTSEYAARLPSTRRGRVCSAGSSFGLKVLDGGA
jgi:hypothetical protein